MQIEWRSKLHVRFRLRSAAPAGLRRRSRRSLLGSGTANPLPYGYYVVSATTDTWKAGAIKSLPASPTTLADGVRTTAIGKRNFEVMFEKGLVDEIVTVTEDQISEAVRVAWSRLHLALEPTGALPLAAFLSGKLPKGRTGLVLSGGNANLQTVATILQSGPR